MSHHNHEVEELLRIIRELLHLKGIHMAQVQFTLSLTVNPPAPPPLSESQSSGSLVLTQGVDAGNAILAAITGGAPPYTAAVDATSPNPLPPGLSTGIDANNNLIISGAATANSNGQANPVVIDVTDSLGNSVAKVTVKT